MATATKEKASLLSVLPADMSGGTIDPLRQKVLLYGLPKVGKTTLASQLHPDPERVLFISTEPGQAAIRAFNAPCKDWPTFRTLGAALAEDQAQDKPRFDLAVVDTVDELQRICRGHVLDTMAEEAGMKGYVHASDFGYGKGYNAVEEEFRLRVAKLCSLGVGVIFISHAKESKVQSRLGEELSAVQPDVGDRGPREWLLGFVDLMFYCQVQNTKDGPQRVIVTAPSETVRAGGRIPPGVELPAVIPMDAENLRAALERVAGT